HALVAQRRGSLFLFRRPRSPMFAVAAAHVTCEPLPVHSRERFVERGEDAFIRAVRHTAQRAFEQQRFEPLDDDASTHLDGGGGADLFGNHFEVHAVRREQINERLRVRAAQKHRSGGPVARHRRHNCDLDKPRAARLDHSTDRFFERGRNRIQIRVNVTRSKKRSRLLRGLRRFVCGDGRKQNVAYRSQLSIRFEERDLALIGAPLNLLAQPRRPRVDVVGANARDARAAQASRKMEARLTEADKADLYLIVHSYERRMNFLNTKGQRVKVFEEDKLYPSLFQPLTLCPFVLKSVLIKAQSEAKLQ